MAASSKNVKNVSRTISERQQMRSASVYYDGMFSTEPIKVPEKVVLKQDLVSDSRFLVELKSSMGESDFLCETIITNDQNYRNGDLVVVSVETCDEMTVGIVKAILVKNSTVYFAIRKCQALRNHLRYFISKNLSDDPYELLKASNLRDFKPLILRGTLTNFVFTLHHHISYDYA